jgi:hypothetical protein
VQEHDDQIVELVEGLQHAFHVHVLAVTFSEAAGDGVPATPTRRASSMRLRPDRLAA